MLGGRDGARASARGEAASAAAALDRFGLAHAAEFPINVLSMGQRRRAALARLLVAYRPLWLLDEPTSALDAAAQARLVEIMRAHLAGGGLIVAATHAPLGLEARELKLGAMEPARSMKRARDEWRWPLCSCANGGSPGESAAALRRAPCSS